MKKDFLWGSASAAYQIEGAANLDGKGLSIWDVYSNIEGNTFKNTTGEVAIDFYHKFEEDIQLMQEMGLKAYRFSISWPRVMPAGQNEVNQKGIDFYHKVIDKLIECGIEPILTIYHWDLPNALQEKFGGWESREIVEIFKDYCILLYKEYGSKVKYWVSLNEQNIFTSLGYLLKIHPPKICDYQTFLNVNHHAFLANALCIQSFRTHVPNGLIGPSYAYGPKYAASAHPKDVIALENALELTDNFWLDVYGKGEYPKIALKILENNGYHIPFENNDHELLKNAKPDFIGVNYYQTNTVESIDGQSKVIEESKNTVNAKLDKLIYDDYFKTIQNPHLKLTDWNWLIDPIGLEVALRRIYSKYDLPVLISENGLGAFDTLNEDLTINDNYRIEFLKEHIIAIQNAQKVGVEVLGYCTWSFQDLFSWLNGYQKRYGFVYIDRDEESQKELKRYKKDSFYWYQKVISSNGENL